MFCFESHHLNAVQIKEEEKKTEFKEVIYDVLLSHFESWVISIPSKLLEQIKKTISFFSIMEIKTYICFFISVVSFCVCFVWDSFMYFDVIFVIFIANNTYLKKQIWMKTLDCYSWINRVLKEQFNIYDGLLKHDLS